MDSQHLSSPAFLLTRDEESSKGTCFTQRCEHEESAIRSARGRSSPDRGKGSEKGQGEVGEIRGFST